MLTRMIPVQTVIAFHDNNKKKKNMGIESRSLQDKKKKR